MLHAEASAAHATELQTQVDTLKFKLTNPTKKISGGKALGASGPTNTRP